MTAPNTHAAELEAAISRNKAIDGIRAYADWLQANPDVPVPSNVDGHVHRSGMSEAEGVAMIKMLAEAWNAPIHTSADTAWINIRLPQDVTGDRLRVEHAFYAHRDKPKSWIE